MNTVIIKYNAGNIRSVQLALERIGVQATVTSDKEMIRAADKVIFPGVGEASTAMEFLKKNELDKLIVSLTQPVLGICLGMQLLCKHSEETDTDCLGVFGAVAVKKFRPEPGAMKVPQIGWNNIYALKSPLFSGVSENSYCYFVHSYYAEAGTESIATTNYITPYCSALQKNNFFGVQFHPEKSAACGEQILKNFLAL